MTREHTLALPTGTVLAAVSPDEREVSYLHVAAPNDALDPAGMLTGHDELVAAVWATLEGSNAFIDGTRSWYGCIASLKRIPQDFRG